MENKKWVIWREKDDTFNCACGNTAWSDGYQPCDEHGKHIEPDKNWNGLYICERCNTIGIYEQFLAEGQA